MQWFLDRVADSRGVEPNPHLCICCRKVFRGISVDKHFVATERALLNQTFKQLQHSATEGCGLCRIRLGQCSQAEKLELETCDKVTFEVSVDIPLGSGIIHIDFHYVPKCGPGENERVIKKTVWVQPKPESPKMSSEADSVRFGASTFIPELAAIVRRWLQLCNKEHDVCQLVVHPEGSFIPPRLVDVGIEEHYSPRICPGASLPQGTKYVTLSHCWGGKIAVTLEKANLKDFMVQLPQSIPKTFADAMQVVRAIGLRYIWIDSLCIVQDSKTDWQGNAALMDRIYEFSWFNIAATGAINSQGGLFLERAPSTYKPIEVFLRLESMSTMEYICWDPEMEGWYRNIDCSVLLSRGWVIQERILSPRILHFAKGQIFWECPRLRSCETFPLGFPINFTFKPSLDTVTLELESLRRQFRIRGRQAFEVWNHHMSMYSKCGLTFPKKDKFLAISGLAKRTGSPDDYVAGLWKSAIVLQLLWSVVGRCERQEEWRAPTWSWASVDGWIHFVDPYDPEFGHYTGSIASVVDASVKLATDNPYGPITDGTLVLDAPLLRSTVYGVDMLHPSNSQHIYLNYVQAHATLDVEYLIEASTVFVMPLRFNSRPDHHPVVSGIILKRAIQPGVFYRCGSFDAEMSSETRWIERFITMVSGESEPKEYGQSLGRLGDSGWKLYRITLK